MRNLARLLLARGVEVHGSDLKETARLRDLRAQGATLWIGHDAAHVVEASPVPDVLVTSSAIRDDNAEVRAAAEAQIPVWRRQQALAALDGGPSHDRGRGHPREDDHDLDARAHPGACRTRPLVPDRRRPERDGWGRTARRRRPVRVRSRRERWLVPAGGAVDRDRHEHRGRPRRLLSGRSAPRSRRRSPPSRPPATAWWPSATTRACRRALALAGVGGDHVRDGRRRRPAPLDRRARASGGARAGPCPR